MEQRKRKTAWIIFVYIRKTCVKKSDLLRHFLHKEKYAYPVYDLDYKKHLTVVKNYFSQFENLFLIGRAGAFRLQQPRPCLGNGDISGSLHHDNKKKITLRKSGQNNLILSGAMLNKVRFGWSDFRNTLRVPACTLAQVLGVARLALRDTMPLWPAGLPEIRHPNL